MLYFGKSDIGNKRTSNEDNYGWYLCSERDVSFFIIADGMGGHQAGEVASKIAVDGFLLEASKYCKSKTKKVLETFAKKTLEKLNADIYDKACLDCELEGMGTTSVIAIVSEPFVTIANVGDSRAYLISKREQKQLTVDHSYVEELISEGLLEREKAHSHPDSHIITRALGSGSSILVDTFNYNYEKSDILILCSDGLNTMVRDEKIYEIANKASSPEEICNSLIEEAKKNGGNDNITIIVVSL